MDLHPDRTRDGIHAEAHGGSRRAGPQVCAGFSVDGGKVRLDGKVRAWFERDIVERTAWGAPGVREADDRVTIGA